MSEQFSEKFVKEMEKLFAWAKATQYMVYEPTSNTCVPWSLKAVGDFEEPGRNKIESFVKAIMKSYIVKHGEEKMDDYKLMVKEFKDNKPKRKRNNMSEISMDEDLTGVHVNFDVDTSMVFYLKTLDYNFHQLKGKLGDPLRTGFGKDSHRWEWKIVILGKVYSIYDWKNEQGEFDDIDTTEWYLGGMVNDRRAIQTLKSYMN